MNRLLSLLLNTVDHLKQARDTARPTLWKEVPRSDNGLSPWAAWTLLCLVRHRLRQAWLAATIATRLGADLEALARAGALAHPDVPQQGLVPQAMEWEYYFHGSGCCFTHRVTGESIDVDFFDDTPDWFDRYFYVQYLKSLKAPPFAAGRILALYGSAEPIQLSFQELLEAGILVKHPERGCVKLHSDCLELEDRLELLEALWDTQPGQLAVAASLGDWLYVAEHVKPDSADAREIQEQACETRDLRNNHLETVFLAGENSDLALQAMAGVQHPKLNDYLMRALQGKPSGTVSKALDIIATLPGSEWQEPLFGLLGRIDPDGDLPSPHIWITAAGHLLRRGYREKEILKQLSRLQGHELGEAAILALEFMPEAAISLFRKALRSTIPYNRTTASAALAIIDAPWSREELAAVLRENDDQLATAECRAALTTSLSSEMHRLVEEWETRNPHEPEVGHWISMDEMRLRHCEGFLHWDMEKLHDRVLPLRSQTPPKPPGKWSWISRWFHGG